MNNELSLQEFEKMIGDAGLDFASDSDYHLWEDEIMKYEGDDLTRDVPKILANAASRKANAKMKNAGSLNEYFTQFREREIVSQPKIRSKQKTMQDMTATEALDQYFDAYRKNL